MKRILAVLLVCFIFVLTGCGETKPVELPLPDPIPGLDDAETVDAAALIRGNEVLFENLKLVCNQIGVDADSISMVEKVEDWDGGPQYTFVCNDYVFRMCCNLDNTVETLVVGTVGKIFDKTEGAYHIDGYAVENNILVVAEALAQDILRDGLGLAENEAVPIMEWYSERENNLYYLFGTINLTMDDGSTEITYFSFAFENRPEEEMLYHRYLILGDTEIENTMSEVVIPNRTPAVQQTA